MDGHLVLDHMQRLLVHDPSRPLSFHSGGFVVLFFGFVLVWSLLSKRQEWRLGWLLLFSLYYYYRCNGLYALVLVALVIADWGIGLLMHNSPSQARRKAWALCGVSLNLATLALFKYASFALQQASSLLGVKLPSWHPFLPIGISFHVFQSIGYLIDVYRQRQAPSRSLRDYALFLSFFPQIVAGPIVRASAFLPQLRHQLAPTSQDIAAGLFLVLQGVVKKAVLADFLGLYADLVLGMPAAYGGFEVLLASYAYAAQIFLDFSGYSDMAVGFARMLGFSLPNNFNAPYASYGLRDFWRRWHISLSSWLRDYLYLPMGGHLVTPVRHHANLLITMILGGLWHGASWTFLAWGALHGLGLCLEHVLRRLPLPTAVTRWARPIAFHWVVALWIVFRSKSFSDALSVFRRLTADWHGSCVLAIASARFWVIVAVALGVGWGMLPLAWEERVRMRFSQVPWPVQAATALAVVELVVAIATHEVRPFIYFQF